MSLAPSGAAADTKSRQRTLLANLRHELRTPLNAVIGYSEMLLEDTAEGQAGPAFRHDLEETRAAGSELLARLNDMLDATKVETGLLEAGLEAFSANLRRELRAPSQAILAYTDAWLTAPADSEWATFLPDLQRIHAAAGRFLALVEDVETYYKIETGEIAAEPGMPSSLALIQDVAVMMDVIGQSDSGVHELTGRLLVVDDNEMNRDVLSRRLGRQGHQVAVAENGRQAMAMLEDGKFDVILLDVMMPEMNGYQMLLQLKSDPDWHEIPVIMISALDEIASVVACIELGAEDYLPKPFDPVILKARIGACLEKKRLRDRERAYVEQLRIEREKSERLLLNILPRAIAELLKEKERTIAENYEAATVLFADLEGFTAFSAAVSAVKLIYLLNEIFSTFDQLAERHGLEKIKTIGDCYMVVGGVPTPRPDHAEAVIDMAQDMLEAMEQFSARHGSPLNIRIGASSGPVVAGIIGIKKFIYDLWGDTVNTASRMESHGVAGRIHVTEATRALLQDKYDFEVRGPISVKGKGEMTTYFLAGAKPS